MGIGGPYAMSRTNDDGSILYKIREARSTSAPGFADEADDDGWTRMSAEGEEGDTTPSPLLEILSDAAIGDMSVQQLRSSLAKRKVAHGHCVEKAELVELLRDTQSRLS